MPDANSNTRFNRFNRPETVTSLAARYQVSPITLLRWLNPIKDKIVIGRRQPFSPAELKIIIDFLGEYNTK